MKYLVKIQSEFLRYAADWDELSYELQKSYLQRHPKSKRKLTAKPEQSNNKIEDIEKDLTNKKVELKAKESLTDNQKLAIMLWGRLLYIDYDSLPEGEDESKSSNFEVLKKEFFDAHKNMDDEKLEELDEWINEGAKINGSKPTITKKTIDNLLKSAETILPEEMTVYKSGSGIIPKNDRWLSMTTKKGLYKHLGNEQEYKLPKGTPVIFTHGLTDEGEIIINSKYLNQKTIPSFKDF